MVVVDKQVVRALDAAEYRVRRLFAASCAERTSPIFGAARAQLLHRQDDIAVVVTTLNDLWNLDIEQSRFPPLRSRLAQFAELSGDEEFTDWADEVCSFAVKVTLDAAECAATGTAEQAILCGHNALTLLDLIDQNVEQSHLFDDEMRRQLDLVQQLSSDPIDGGGIDKIRNEDQTLARARVTAAMATISST